MAPCAWGARRGTNQADEWVGVASRARGARDPGTHAAGPASGRARDMGGCDISAVGRPSLRHDGWVGTGGRREGRGWHRAGRRASRRSSGRAGPGARGGPASSTRWTPWCPGPRLPAPVEPPGTGAGRGGAEASVRARASAPARSPGAPSATRRCATAASRGGASAHPRPARQRQPARARQGREAGCVPGGLRGGRLTAAEGTVCREGARRGRERGPGLCSVKLF